ncbi:Uncharacterised protein [Vibrio cholerae]|nr:Uncharacterised protein [Vibrio cholerae]CSI79725.1 Uncharacterised protein [Vibrio cholerae]
MAIYPTSSRRTLVLVSNQRFDTTHPLRLSACGQRSALSIA